MDRLYNNDPMLVGLWISKLAIFIFEYFTLFLGKSDETYAFSPDDIRHLVDLIRDEYRTGPDAAEYIVLQAVAALKLDFRRRKFVLSLRNHLAGLGTPISLTEYLKLTQREGGFLKNHIRQVPI